MLTWAILFAAIAATCGWLGYRDRPGVGAAIARGLMVCYAILCLLALLAVFGVFRLS